MTYVIFATKTNHFGHHINRTLATVFPFDGTPEEAIRFFQAQPYVPHLLEGETLRAVQQGGDY